jgi:hypothetical protein
MSRKVLIITWTLLAVLVSVSFGRNSSDSTQRPAIRISPVAVDSGVELPADYLSAFQKELGTQLQKIHTFRQVLNADETADGSGPVLLLKATLTEFKPGSRAKRIFSTAPGRYAGVGQTKLVTHIRLEDTTSDSVLYENDIAGAQKGNPSARDFVDPTSIVRVGGVSKSVVHIDAKNIAKALKAALQHEPQKQ